MADAATDHGWTGVFGAAGGAAAATLGAFILPEGQQTLSGAHGDVFAWFTRGLVGLMWAVPLFLCYRQVREVTRRRGAVAAPPAQPTRVADAKSRNAERDAVRAYLLAIVKHADSLFGRLPRDGMLIATPTLQPRPITISEVPPSAPQYSWFPEWVEIDSAIRLMQTELARLTCSGPDDAARYQKAIASRSPDPDPRRWTLGAQEWLKWARRQRDVVRGLCEDARTHHVEIGLPELPAIQDEDEVERLKFEEGLFEKVPPRYAEVMVRRVTATLGPAVLRARTEGVWPSGVVIDIDRLGKTRTKLMGYPGNGAPFAEFTSSVRRLDVLITDHRLGKPVNVNSLLNAADEVLQRAEAALPNLDGLK